jgi:N6-L-threonylcarbamoyladenine synthase
MIGDKTLNFSFSGLKTAVMREWKKYQEKLGSDLTGTKGLTLINTFAFEIQEAITDVLVTKTLRAVREYNASSIIVSGGVAANQRLTQKFTSQIKNLQPTTHNPQLSLHIPPPYLCVDSATYIAAYGFYHNNPIDWKQIVACPNLAVEI